MPALINPKPNLEPFDRPKETTESLDWAPLAIIDLSAFDSPGGKEALARQLKDALTRWGFWVVTGTGIPQEQVDRQLAIANAFFKLPIEEKRKVPCDFSVGNYFGYREPTRFIGNTDVKENMEMLNLPKSTPDYDSVPRHEFIKTFQDEIAPFHRLVWENVIRKLFVLFAIILELPENYFVDRHSYDVPSEDHLRYMIYHPRSAEDDKKINEQWSVGHTDFGQWSLTLLFAQTVAALQIRTPDNEWKWVKPVEGGITCNAADTISFLTKGYIKSTVHRVVRPPADQTHLERLGLFYFARPGDDVPMLPAPSPVLRREGFLTKEDETASEEDAVKGYEYVRARVKNVHDRKATRIAVNTEDTVFKVKNLAVQDLYL
ncbi:hypothetical protein Hypma_009341 [Hypsizygus marmoreus]|uniref:Fe2OG dioxygenase domain-containing protein n=1 Tax=Hypsizygus marmoreus TaxID=39966 RepID=A0A369JQ99_HYPMA|nr:hypothetical protein Hypma_009341 [Hypsizygus marmoreus]